MQVIAIVNQKGGCGKTTTSVNLSSVLAARGMRVLLVDLDPQSHCAAGLGVPEDRIEYSTLDFLLEPDQRPFDRSAGQVKALIRPATERRLQHRQLTGPTC